MYSSSNSLGSREFPCCNIRLNSHCIELPPMFFIKVSFFNLLNQNTTQGSVAKHVALLFAVVKRVLLKINKNIELFIKLSFGQPLYTSCLLETLLKWLHFQVSCISTQDLSIVMLSEFDLMLQRSGFSWHLTSSILLTEVREPPDVPEAHAEPEDCEKELDRTVPGHPLLGLLVADRPLVLFYFLPHRRPWTDWVPCAPLSSYSP